MGLQELSSAEALSEFCSSNANALVCFSATWCGPCRKSHPALMDLAESYEKDTSMDLKMALIYESNLGDDIHAYNVKAFPTYVLFQNSTEVGRVEGVNFDGIRNLVASKGCKKALGAGHSLGGGDSGMSNLSPAEARAKRLEKLQQAMTASTAPPAAPADAAKQEDVEMKEAASVPEKEKDGDQVMAEPEEIDQTANLDKEALDTLTGAMGFPLLRAQKGLLYGNGSSVEGAVEWLLEHQDDDDIDEPIPMKKPSDAAGVAQSYKCNDCGKVLSSMANLELHANKTGHADFEESTQAIKPLTAEEKAAKMEEIKGLLKAKRSEREDEEKEEEIVREKQRRSMGKEMSKTREQMDREARKREAITRKREKQAVVKERERIRAELEKDKRERMANKGKLSSKLGVDGYNPDAIQYEVPGAGESADQEQQKEHVKKPPPSAAKIEDYIKKVSAYRAGGDGGKCLKILLAYISNVVNNPEEDKFKRVNMENKAYKGKVKPFLGAKQLLLAVGFVLNESGDTLVLGADADLNLLSDTKDKLEKALAVY
eukprot:scaffold204358_cov57-Attheya_sp.AAC.3